MKGFHKKFLILFVLFFVLTITGQVSAQTSGAGLYIETGSGKVFAEKKGDFYQISGNNNQKILFTEDQITAYSKNGIIPTEEKLNKNKTDYLTSQISSIDALKTDQANKNTQISALLGDYGFTDSQKSQVTTYLTEHQFDSVKKTQTTDYNNLISTALFGVSSAGGYNAYLLSLLMPVNTPITTTNTRTTTGTTYTNNATSVCSTSGCSYTLLAPIGGLLGDSNGKYVISKADKDGLCQLLNSWFRIGIALAGMLAVVMIVLGGFQYATTDAMSSKEDGKGKIQNALWGLLLALTTWLVISTINPDLTKCTINAGEVKLGKVTSTSGVSNDGVLNRSSNTLATGSTGDSTKSQSEIEAEYNKVYSQWTDADDEELASGSKTAEEKWNSVQSQIDSLNTKYATQKSSGSGVVGSANQKILSEISAGNKSSSTNCFESAVCLAKDAGVTYSRVFQNNDYIVGGKTLTNTTGSARMPVAGEMVDMYTGYDKSDPFHTVIVNSIDENGTATVWDWKHNASTGLRKVEFNLTNSGTKGYIGRIYEPK